MFDFKTLWDRRGHDALAVDTLGTGMAPDAPREGFDAIPMWVADMSFATAPSVTRALRERMEHPLYGYFTPSDAYFDAICRWQSERNGVRGLKPVHIGYENGVLGGLLSAVGALCEHGASILIHSPTYGGFTHSLTNAGYTLVHSPLLPDAQGVFRMDLADMESKIVENGIRVAVFCSPHNPTGRVWERWEVEAAMELFCKHGVHVVSDEIWSDLLLFGHRHVPTQSVSEDARMRTVALYAPSKTFNLAGLVGSYHIIYNDELRARVEQVASLSHYNNVNALSVHALIGAYSDGGAAWLGELLSVLGQNVEEACRYFSERTPDIFFSRPQGTYMLFLDVRRYLQTRGMTLSQLLKRGWDVGVAWQDGRQHGGTEHIRLNLALPTARLREVFSRLDTYVFTEN